MHTIVVFVGRRVLINDVTHLHILRLLDLHKSHILLTHKQAVCHEILYPTESVTSLLVVVKTTRYLSQLTTFTFTPDLGIAELNYSSKESNDQIMKRHHHRHLLRFQS